MSKRIQYRGKMYKICGETDEVYFLSEKKDCTKKFAVKKSEIKK